MKDRLNLNHDDLMILAELETQTITRTIMENAFKTFERQLEECAERALGCDFLQGLKAGRVTVSGGQPFVDGKQIAFVQPPKLLDGQIVWTMHDLIQEGQP